MKVVIGLGNPGKKYEKTRHNIGFVAIDNLRKKMNISDEREKFQALISEKNIDGEKVIFFKTSNLYEPKWKLSYRDCKFL